MFSSVLLSPVKTAFLLAAADDDERLDCILKQTKQILKKCQKFNKFCLCTFVALE